MATCAETSNRRPDALAEHLDARLTLAAILALIADLILLFCLEDTTLEKVIVAKAKEDLNAVRMGCPTHR